MAGVALRRRLPGTDVPGGGVLVRAADRGYRRGGWYNDRYASHQRRLQIHRRGRSGRNSGQYFGKAIQYSRGPVTSFRASVACDLRVTILTHASCTQTARN